MQHSLFKFPILSSGRILSNKCPGNHHSWKCIQGWILLCLLSIYDLYNINDCTEWQPMGKWLSIKRITFSSTSNHFTAIISVNFRKFNRRVGSGFLDQEILIFR